MPITLAPFIYSYGLPLILALLTLSYILNKNKSGPRSIPGPRLAAYTKLWRLHDVYNGSSHLTAIALHAQHGKLVRIAPNVISVADPEEILKIYGIRGEFTKTAFYPIQEISWRKRPRPNLFSLRDEVRHREDKRKVAGAYGLESLLKMEPAIDGCGELFLGKMGEFADRGELVDLGRWVQYYAFDVVGEITFAQKFGFLSQGSDIDGMMGAIEGMLSYAAICGQVPELHPFLLGNPLFPILLPQMEKWNQVLVFTLKALNHRTKISRDGELELDQSQAAGGDMLTRFAAVKSLDPLKMSTTDVVVALAGNVFAGSDTTAIALRAILYFLMKDADKMQKLQAEIDRAADAGRISKPISDKEARALPYLNAVIKEALRLHSSVGLLLERHVPAGGTTICGKYIPGGTIVGINPWVLQHDPAVYPDPRAFKPERWLEAPAEHLAAMDRSFFAFGAGNRVCLGKKISYIEMRKIIPELVREFDISLPEGVEWEVKNIWFTQQSMPKCVMKRRTKMQKFF